MASVEDKIVAMKFDNKQFEPAAKTTMSTLDRLKAALNFSGSGKGLHDLQNTANRFSLAKLGESAVGVGSKFTAMGVVGAAALATLTAKAVSAGLKIGQALTLKPLKAGFDEYELKMGSIQTILSNTARYGTKLPEVTANLDALNKYADKTIYNFGDMTKNIGLFTNAGIRVGDATSMIKGFSNEAAASGTSAQGAASAAYQLSQALSAGTIRLMDWRSLQNVGMGNKNMQNGLIELAESMGTLEKAGISAKSVQEDFNGSLEKKWLSADVMSKYLKIMAGDLSVAEQKSLGLSDAQIKMFKTQQKNAEDAATKVRTFTQLTGTIAESIGSGWAETFNLLIGDFNQATDLWTGVNDTLGKMIGKWGDARNKLIKDWADAGGRTNLLKGFENIFKAVVAIAKPIKEAFRNIFPAMTGERLNELTKMFLRFTTHLDIGAKTAGLVKRSFAGFFAIFSIGWSLVKALAGVLGDLFGVVFDGSGSFLEVTARIGDWIVALDKSIKKGNVFVKFFDKLKGIFAGIIGFVKGFGSVFADMFDGFKVGGIEGALGRIKDRLASFGGASSLVAKAWGGLIKILGKLGQVLAPIGEAIGKALSGIGDAIAKAFEAGDFNSVYDAINTGLLTGIVLLIKKFLGEGLKIDFGGGLGASIKETFGALTSTLSAMQAQIQAKTLMSIAIAVGVLTVSIVALSLIDSGKLTKALTAMAVAFGQLLTAMAILTKISGAAGFTKIPLIAASMILLSTAILILTAAVRNLSGLSWEELAKGLIGTGALLVMLVGVARGLEKASGSMLRAGLAMIPLSVGILILSKAVSSMAGMSWSDMARGMVGIAAAITILAVGLKFMTGSLAGSAALLVAAAALNVMVPALERMGEIPWQNIGKIMVVLFGSLLLLAAGMYAMTAALPGAAALLVAAAALLVLTPALERMGQLKWAEIGKIMVVLFGSLLLLAAGLTAMILALPGAAALTVATAALAVLAPVLVILGSMSWEAIGKGLVAIAGAFVVLGLAGFVLAPVVPVIIALSAALLLLGVSMALIGVGALALATAFSIFVAAGTAGIAVLLGMINLIPQFMKKFAEGIGQFAVTIAQQATKFTKAFTSLLNSLLDAVIKCAPKIGKAFNVLMATALNIVVTNAPKIADAGVKLVLALLKAITSNIPKIVAAAAKMIVAFITETNKHVPKIAKAGTQLIVTIMKAISASQGKLIDQAAKMIIAFVRQLASTIRARSGEMRAAGRELASAIASGLSGGLTDKIGSVARSAASLAKRAFEAAKAAIGVNSPSKAFIWLGEMGGDGFGLGFDRSRSTVVQAADRMANQALTAVSKTMSRIGEAFESTVDINPTITPILDLSKVTADAAKISDVLGKNVISADASFNQARAISNSTPNVAPESTPAPVAPQIVELKLEQNNYSPKALSASEIYRNTRSQLSLAKGALQPT